MAVSTQKTLRNQVMYQVFVRNFSDEGTFAAVQSRLDEIKALGTDIIWFMPIHPIGRQARKGTHGSPYAISDYREVNPEFGSMSDFKSLVGAIHGKGMKCIIDVVYNHTSPDSVLSQKHPEWFYHRPDGSFGNRVGDWTDIIDLDYSNRELWDYQIETLKFWAGIVDGFRCDVAPLIPLEFWLKAREEVETVREGCIWLSESVEPGFITYMRGRGMTALSDSEIFQAFDMAYDYDIYDWYLGYLQGANSLRDYCIQVNRQEYTYPDNYVKARYLENHDQPRAHSLIPDERCLRNWTAFQFFQKGAAMLYAGQEKGCIHCPGLFDRDPVIWEGHGTDGTDLDLSPMIRTLADMKKDPVLTDSTYHLEVLQNDIVAGIHIANRWRPDSADSFDGPAMIGIFPMRGERAVIDLEEVMAEGGVTLAAIVQDGRYENIVDGTPVEVIKGRICTDGRAVILRTQ